MIEVTNLTKKYGNHVAVDDLSFRVEKGQIYGFLGPNGAGKSTTMNIITGYLAATSGTVKIGGFDVLKEPEEAKKHIGYLPELPPVYGDMTVKEYLYFVAELKKVSKTERAEQVSKVMEMTSVTEMQNRLIKNLSKGYRQRVGLAQAIVGFPEVIILDEPTVGLDPKQIIEVRDLIRELGKNHTIILSSHILFEVSAICDRIMIINHGKLLACDSPDGLQNLINSEDELNILIKGEEEAIRNALSDMEAIQSVTFVRPEDAVAAGETAPEADYLKVKILMKREDGIKDKIVDALAENRLPIYEMNYTQKTLEDIFLELTGIDDENYADDDEEFDDEEIETKEEK